MRIENSGTATRGQQQNSSRSYPNISMTRGDLEEAKWESSGYAGNHNKPRMAMDSLMFKSHRMVHQMEIAPSAQVLRTRAITVLLKICTNRPRTESTPTLNIMTTFYLNTESSRARNKAERNENNSRSKWKRGVRNIADLLF
jgi:hypothetical protein